MPPNPGLLGFSGDLPISIVKIPEIASEKCDATGRIFVDWLGCVWGDCECFWTSGSTFWSCLAFVGFMFGGVATVFSLTDQTELPLSP